MTIEELASQVEVLLRFAATLIPEKETIKNTLASLDEQSEFALSAAPLLLAHGIDYEDSHFQNKLRAKRAKALYELLDVLDKTESDRCKRETENFSKLNNRRMLQAMLGMPPKYNNETAGNNGVIAIN